MTLLSRLDANGITLRIVGGRLSVTGDQRVLADPDLMASLRVHKDDLLELVKQRSDGRQVAGAIPEGASVLTPEMVPLATLDQAQLDRLIEAIPGGVANIQDIYPLAPLQEGILFHHRLQTDSDAYVLPTLLRFDSQPRLDRFLSALNEVIARHDILRTSVHWEGLDEPVQVVWREANVSVEEISVDPDLDDDASSILPGHQDPAGMRIDVRRAPMLRARVSFDVPSGRWLLQLIHHHLILDHTASELLIREVALIIEGRQAELSPPVPFRQFVVRARQDMSDAEHEIHFRQQLGDVTEPTAPFDLMDVQGDGSKARRAAAQLDAVLAARLRRQCRARGASPASLFHLAWAMVLASCTGRDDVVFGTVLFGRMQGGVAAARALGMFLNTLPVRLRLGAVSVEQGLKQAQATLHALLQHEHASLVLAQRCSGVSANLPLFTSLLNYRYSANVDNVDRDAAPMLEGIEYLGGHDRTNYPFVMHVDDLGEGFGLIAEVHERIASSRVTDLMLHALSGLVDALESAPHMPLSAIDALPAAERRQVLETFNDTAVAYPSALLHGLIEEQVARSPDAIALRCDDRTLTYAALNAQANRLARHLRTLGVRPDRLVAVLLERGEAMVVALLATLKAGGAYLPLDPAYPPERWTQMLDDSAPVVVLTQASLLARMQVDPVPRLVMDSASTEALLSACDSANPDPGEVGLHPGHLAYVIYTSGSTGRPKGAMNEHRGIVNRLQWMQQAYGLDAQDVVLQKTPFGFDVSVWEFFWPLMTGAQLVMARPEGHKDPGYLGEVIRSTGVTTLHFVPSMLQVFLGDAEAVSGCARVRRVICSGEALPASLVRLCRARWPQVELHNLYGPTEAAVDVTAWACGEDEALVPIGRPIANTRVYLLDGHGRPVPVGVAGELYIGGVQVARGYLNRPELSAERFVTDPFMPGGRMYRTGDLARWREDGAIEYLGRNDFQVKIRGFRIELGEIEAQLMQVRGVREAVVVSREDRAGEPQLVAYVVAPELEASELEPAALRARLGRALPAYMVPAAYVRLEALPLSAHGKLERRGLPAPEGEAFTRVAFEAPEGEVERLLAGIWSALLGVEGIGRQDHFFELGGHSLLAIRLLEHLRRAGWTLEIRALFDHARLWSMAAALQAISTEETQAIEVPENAIPAEFGASDSEQDFEEIRI